MTRILTLEEYRTLQRPELHWIVPGLVPSQGMVLLLGSPKAGKSSLALQIALSIAQGDHFMGKSCVPHRVLYIQLDEGELSFREGKLNTLKRHGVSLHGPVYMVHPEDERRGLNILLDRDYIYLQHVISSANPQLIVLDVLREFYNGDENDSGVVKVAMDRIASLTSGRSALILHHIHKLNPQFPVPRPADASRGSSYIAGKVDAIWLLHESILKIQSRFGPEVSLTARRQPSGLFTFSNPPNL